MPPLSVNDLAVEVKGLVFRLVERCEDEMGLLRAENSQLRAQLQSLMVASSSTPGAAQLSTIEQKKSKYAPPDPDTDSGDSNDTEVWRSLDCQTATSKPPALAIAPSADKEPSWSSQTAKVLPEEHPKEFPNGLSNELPRAPQFLKITMVSATGLRDADHMIGAGLSDPYCVCAIAGQPQTRCKTRAINDTVNPVWAHCCLLTWEPGESLVFSVFDKDVMKKDDLLGTAELSSELFQAKGFDGKLQLVGRGADESKLSVKVSPFGWEDAHDGDADAAICEKLRRDCLEKWSERSHQFCETAILPRGISACSRNTGPRLGGSWGTERGYFSRFVLHPLSFKRTIWSTIGLLLVFYDTIIIPYQAAFNEGEIMAVAFLAFVAAFWTCDLLSSFFVGFYRDGLVELRFSRIARKYAKSWFMIDFSILVVDWAFILTSSGSSASILRVIRSVRAVRSLRAVSLLRAPKIKRHIDAFLQGPWSEHVLAAGQVGNSIVIILWVNHCIACTWYMIGSQLKERTWVKVGRVAEQNTAYAYFTSLHWALTQFTPASSEIQPTNAVERAFAILIDLFGLIAFSTFVSSITSRMTTLRSSNKERLKQDEHLRCFFVENGVSLELAKCVVENVKSQRLLRNRRFHEKDLPALAQLPGHLRDRLRMEVFVPVIAVHPFFACLAASDDDRPFLALMCHNGLRQIAAHIGEEVFVTGSEARCMIFITGGAMVYQRGEFDIDLTEGDWVCEAALWIEQWAHRGVLSAKSWSEIVQLDGEVFRSILVTEGRNKALGNLFHCYAVLFLSEGCEDALPLMRWTDVWGSQEVLEGLVRRGLEQSAPDRSPLSTKST